MNVVLISTYEMGRQPFGVASPAAWLRREGCSVACLDLAVEPMVEEVVAAADLIAFYIPMHTATRLATRLVGRIRRINPRAHLCFYGLYAPVNGDYLKGLGAGTLLGGEFEEGLASLARRLSTASDEEEGPDAGQGQSGTASSWRQQRIVSFAPPPSSSSGAGGMWSLFNRRHFRSISWPSS